MSKNNAEARKQYRIVLTICRDNGPQFERIVFMSDKPRWDGAWFSENPVDARIYTSKAWAYKWLADRPHIDYGKVEEVR